MINPPVGGRRRGIGCRLRKSLAEGHYRKQEGAEFHRQQWLFSHLTSIGKLKKFLGNRHITGGGVAGEDSQRRDDRRALRG